MDESVAGTFYFDGTELASISDFRARTARRKSLGTFMKGTQVDHLLKLVDLLRGNHPGRIVFAFRDSRG